MRLDAFVLAGGRSQRMGSDKARLPFPADLPMAVHIAEVLRPLVASVSLVRRGAPDGMPWTGADGLEVPVVREPEQAPRHPLMGIVTACDAGRTPLVLIVPCDLPFLPALGVVRLLEAAVEPVGSQDDLFAQAVVAVGQPLLAVVPLALGPLALVAASEGRAARSFLAGARQVPMEPAWLRNVNRWQDTGRPHPLDLLLDLPGLSTEADRDRVLRGERTRLLQRGLVLPPR